MQNPRRKLDAFSSVLACAKSAHVFQKLSYPLCELCLSLLSLITLPQTVRLSAFHCTLRLPNSSTLCFHFLQVDVKAWPRSQNDLFTRTTVLHCRHTFLRCIDLLHSIVCTMVLHCGHTFPNLLKRQSQTS